MTRPAVESVSYWEANTLSLSLACIFGEAVAFAWTSASPVEKSVLSEIRGWLLRLRSPFFLRMRLGLDLTLFVFLSIGSETTASTEEVGDALVA